MHAGMQIELFCERRYRGEAEIWDKASKAEILRTLII